MTINCFSTSIGFNSSFRFHGRFRFAAATVTSICFAANLKLNSAVRRPAIAASPACQCAGAAAELAGRSAIPAGRQPAFRRDRPSFPNKPGFASGLCIICFAANQDLRCAAIIARPPAATSG